MSSSLDPSGPESDRPLESAVFEWDLLKNVPTPHGVYRPMVDAPSPPFVRVEMHATTLLPGHTSHEPHQHPQEEIILIKEGLVECWINGQTTRAGPDSLIFFASYDLHGLTSVGHVPATYYVLNFYTTASEALHPPTPPHITRLNRFSSAVIAGSSANPNALSSIGSRRWLSSPTTTLGRFEVDTCFLASSNIYTPSVEASQAQVIIVKEGMLELTLPTKVQVVQPGALVYLPPLCACELRAMGHRAATFFLLSFAPSVMPSS